MKDVEKYYWLNAIVFMIWFLGGVIILGSDWPIVLVPLYFVISGMYLAWHLIRMVELI